MSIQKLLSVAGALLLVLGLLMTAFVLVGIGIDQSDCQGGLSPVPPQGCGYVPQLVLFNRGTSNSFPTLLWGLYLAYTGTLILAIIWLSKRTQRAPSPSAAEVQ